MITNRGRQKEPPGFRLRSRAALLVFLAAAMLVLAVQGTSSAQSGGLASGISKSAVDSCDAKIKRLEAYDAAHPSGGHQTTRFSDAEWNSYLAIVLKPNYHPSLREIQLKFEEGRLQAFASIDFDKLNINSTKSVNNLLRSMLAGVHILTVWGRLISDSGKASFRLDEARFDTITLPNVLVVEIISAVGRRQNPPFDPMQPNDLPYHIQKVAVHSGYIEVYQ